MKTADERLRELMAQPGIIVAPKRCGHTSGKQTVSRKEALAEFGHLRDIVGFSAYNKAEKKYGID